MARSIPSWRRALANLPAQGLFRPAPARSPAARARLLLLPHPAARPQTLIDDRDRPAALERRAGFTVWLCYDLDGNRVLDRAGRHRQPDPLRAGHRRATARSIARRCPSCGKRSRSKSSPTICARCKRRSGVTPDSEVLDGAELGASAMAQRLPTASAPSRTSTTWSRYLEDELDWPLQKYELRRAHLRVRPGRAGPEGRGRRQGQDDPPAAPAAARPAVGHLLRRVREQDACRWWCCAASSATWCSRSAPRANRADARRLAPGRPALHLRLWRRGHRPARDRLRPLPPGGGRPAHPARAGLGRRATPASSSTTWPLRCTSGCAGPMTPPTRTPGASSGRAPSATAWATSSAPPTRWPSGWPRWRAASATPRAR